MDKKELTKQIDALIVSCAIGMGCDEVELKRLAIEYATHFTGPYELSRMHLRALDENLEMGIQLTKKVNVFIDAARARIKSVKGMGSFVSGKLSLPQTCKCTPTKKYIFCKMPPHLCKFTKHSLVTIASRQSPKASPKASPKVSPKASPKSPKASPKASPTKCRKPGCNMGGKRRTQTKRRRN
jgi:hypothetical protein